ncbi:response regulator transcription factor [Methylocystis sp.]|uniref:response regulator transcription factor n=1 Tax=Methylocystis sp. TaxID=1911079 RepID=UPI0025E23E9C|nr:response regulator transcription factor [Methylocystis sp.]
MTILLVEDEPEMAGLIVDQIRHAGLVVDHMSNLADARQALRDLSYDLVLLDRRLPDGDGLSLVPEIRAAQPGLRVIMLTALDKTRDKVAGLDNGADDYLIKPFDVEELLARIRACLRRPGGTTIPPIKLGSLEFDFATRAACVRNRPVLFHGKELALLEALLRRAGQVVARKTLMGEIYGLDEETLPNALDVLVSRLRRRLNQLEAGIAIHAARGIGYLFAEQTP